MHFFMFVCFTLKLFLMRLVIISHLTILCRKMEEKNILVDRQIL